MSTTIKSQRLIVRQVDEVKIIRAGIAVLIARKKLDMKTEMRAIELYRKVSKSLSQ